MTSLPVAPPGGDADQAERAAARRLAGIARAVLDALGRPPEFLRATGRLVGGDRFRVNVVVGPDPAAARIAHSFFVTVDAAGTLTGSTPAIRRCY